MRGGGFAMKGTLSFFRGKGRDWLDRVGARSGKMIAVSCMYVRTSLSGPFLSSRRQGARFSEASDHQGLACRVECLESLERARREWCGEKEMQKLCCTRAKYTRATFRTETSLTTHPPGLPEQHNAQS